MPGVSLPTRPSKERDADLRAHMSANKLQPLSKRTKLNVKIKAVTLDCAPPTDGAGQNGEKPSAPGAAAAAAATTASVGGRGSINAGGGQVPMRAISVINTLPKAAPKTSFDFENAWRSINGNAGHQAAYLKLMVPSSLPSIFKTSLTGTVLASLVRTVLISMSTTAGGSTLGTEDKDPGGGDESKPLLSVDFSVDFLSNLVKVERFDMTAMCLTGKDKTLLKGLWDSARGHAAGREAELDGLRKKFRL
eukprot:gene32706-17133_t